MRMPNVGVPFYALREHCLSYHFRLHFYKKETLEKSRNSLTAGSGLLVCWSLTALLTQLRSYRALKVKTRIIVDCWIYLAIPVNSTRQPKFHGRSFLIEYS